MDNQPEIEKDLKETSRIRREAILFIWETLKFVIISLAIIIPIRYYVVQPFFVRGASMEPIFENNDYILIDEISYRLNDPKRGEVIVFKSPEDTSQFFIKRVIGLPEETVLIQNNEVKIFNNENPEGFVLDESSYLDPKQRTDGSIKMKLDPNEYFMMGDNRIQSSDSRRWGALNKALITGRVFIKVLPVGEFGKLKLPEY